MFDLKPKTISLCTSCMGRLHHVYHTLPKNLEDNNFEGTTFVLLDYNSTDGLEDWIRNSPNIQKHIVSGKLLYFKENSATEFLRCHARNLSFKLAPGAIVCNVDADNYTGKDFDLHILSLLNEPNVFAAPIKRDIHDNKQKWIDSCGRLAFLKKDFLKIGGYNEELNLGWGGEDLDLVDRALGLDFMRKDIDYYFLDNFIAHTNEDRFQHHVIKDCMFTNKTQMQISARNLLEGKFVANEGKNWGAATVVKNFSHEVQIS